MTSIPSAMAVEIRNLQRKFRVPLRTLRREAEAALRGFRIRDPELSIVLVNDRRIRGLNRQYRKKDKATDVLAFSMREGGSPQPALLGDVVISVERAAAQAAEKGHCRERELRILLVHGILHLLGYDHEKSPREAARMRRMERTILKRISP